MAEIKKLQTRIALKYDTYANWTDDKVEGKGANLVLLPGEIGFCEIPSGNSNATNAPTVLFKVGNGEKKFSELNWASALAADVYSWAKAADVVLEGKSIKFKNGEAVVKEIAIPYMTEAEVKALIKPVSDDVATLKTDVADLKSKFEGDSSVQNQIDGLDGRLATAETNITNLGTNKLDKSVYDAYIAGKAMSDEELKSYADNKASAAQTAAEGTASAALTAAVATLEGADTTLGGRIDALVGDNGTIAAGDAATLSAAQTYADGKASAAESAAKTHAETKASEAQAAAEATAAGALSAAVSTLNAKDAELAGAIENLTKENGVIAGINTAIADEVEARKAADKAITDSIGTVADGKTVVKMIEDAQAAAEANAATAAQGKVDALANGAVATNASEIARVEGKFDDYVEAQAELGHESRIAAMEAFFEGATRDEGEGENLKNALDTLKEIQDFATGEGTAAEEMLKSIDDNAKAIKAVEDIVKDGGTLEVRVDEVEAAASANAGAIEALQTLTGDNGAIRSEIAAAAAKGQTGIDNAATAQAAAEAADAKAQGAQDEVDALEGVVSTLRGEYDVTKQAAIDNAADIAAIEAEFGDGGRVTALEADSHTHAFVETELNKIADGDVAKWNEAYNKRHEHSFVEDELEKVVAGDVEKWNTAATTAATAASDLAALTTRVGTAEGEIDALQAIVGGEDGNVALGAEIDALAAIVNGEDGNVALGDEIDALAAKVNDGATGLVATKAIADEALTKAKDAQSRVAAIESDYLKAEDLFIIDCGTASTVTHEMPKSN